MQIHISKRKSVTTEESASAPRSQTEVSLLDITVLLVAHKRFIVRFVLGAAVLAIVIVPCCRFDTRQKSFCCSSTEFFYWFCTVGTNGESGSVGIAQLTGGGLGLKTPADMYVSLLTSRNVADAMIQRFGLMAEYHKKRMSDARRSSRAVRRWLPELRTA